MCLAGYMYFIDVQLIYNAVLISAIQQSYCFMYLYIYIHTHTYIFSFILFFMMVYHRILNIVPEGMYIFECCLNMTHLNSSSFNQICFFSHTLKLFWGHYFQWTRVVFFPLYPRFFWYQLYFLQVLQSLLRSTALRSLRS